MQLAKTKHYAKALVEVVDSKNWEKEIADLRLLNDQIEQIVQLRNFLYSATQSIDLKKQFIKENFTQFSKTLINFILLLIKNNKLDQLLKIINEADKIYKKQNNIQEAIVNSVIELNEKQKQELQSVLQDKFSNQVKIINILDKSVKAGLIIQIKDQVIDASFNGKLKRLKNIIK